MKTFITAVIAILFLVEVNAQSAGSIGITDGRSVGMAKTYTTDSKGLGALGINPANIFSRSDTTRKWEIITVFPLPQLGMKVGTNFLSINEFNYFFGESTTDASGKKVGKYLTADDKARLVNLFSDGGTIQSDIQSTIFAISWKPSAKAGAFTFAISDVIGSNVTFPKGLVELLMNGNPPGDVFKFDDTQAKAWWLRKYSISWAHGMKFFPKIFQDFNYGFSFNFVSGYFYFGIDRMNSLFTTGDHNSLTIKNDFMAHSSFSPDFGVTYSFDSASTKTKSSPSLFPSPAGNGFGMDLGFWGKINDVWGVGLSFTDLGSIKWKEKVAEFTANSEVVITDLSDTNQTKDLGDKLTGKNESKVIGAYKTPLPTAMHVGVSFQLDKFLKGHFPGRMIIVADYNQGFNDELRNSKKARFSIGAEWIPTNWIFAFRTGLSFGGFDKFGLGAGMGINFGFLELNGGTPDFHYLFMPNGAKRISFAFDSKWKF